MIKHKALRRLRHAANMTQAELAEAAGLERVYITLLEGGKRSNMTCRALLGIINALGCNAGDLVRGL